MNTRTQIDEPTGFARGSGNVFADLALPEPEDMLAKARLAEAIDDTIRRRKLSQGAAATLLATDQGTVSKVVNGRLDGFSQDRLIRYLRALGDDVEILIRRPEHYGSQGHLTVTTA